MTTNGAIPAAFATSSSSWPNGCRRAVRNRMSKLSIRDLDLAGKRVFVRVDFNVPLKDGHVGDATRIIETLPTLRLARERGARLVLASHLGRPKGKPDPKYSLRPVVE